MTYYMLIAYRTGSHTQQTRGFYMQAESLPSRAQIEAAVTEQYPGAYTIQFSAPVVVPEEFAADYAGGEPLTER
ncbi:hypothetical protein DYU11_20040 [Fibrisoma montanum]|uniref:Uncharacterized protein n=1 Tax=Fibrisoma montanum TaxID=2305895 RepID=A0A418M3W1_9BACT|nr:hypothetical protein [Fibrisoma montanum]RIV20344.1 hypothetical protein DYU11_20040 [Fibrisoma montanum]